MWTICIFCTLLGTLVPISDAISAVITPEYEAFVSKGENITLHCTLLDLNSSTHTAEDILWYKDSVLLPSKLSHPVSLNTSQLTVVNSTFEDSGNYGCGFPEDTYSDRELIVVTVALPPAQVQNLTCRSYDVLNVHCTWEEGAVETNTRNIHEAHFREYRKEKLLPVNQDSDYSCSFAIISNTKVFVRVTSTNNLGSAMVEIFFDSQTQVTPHAPEHVSAAPNSSNGNSVLKVTWGPPSGWITSFFSLNYRLRYRSESSSDTKEIKIIGAMYSKLLTGLNPFTTYEIEVAAKSPVASDLYWGEPGRTLGTTLEGSPFGSVSGLSLLSDTDSTQTGLRHVHLQWQPPPRDQWGSESINYNVRLIPMDTSPGHSLKDYNRNVTGSMTSILIHDVSKYQTYSVKIKPFNNFGEGPETHFQDKIPDRTSVPGKPTDLNVTLMESNAFHIRWQPPQNPNGLIYEYEVIVTGNATLSSNESSVIEEGALKTRTQSKVIQVAFNCTELTEKGHPMEVLVAARTKNYTNHFFQGSYSKFTQNGVCKEKKEPSFIFIGIFIPCIIIVSCIVALLIWNFFKDTCVEPPEPYIPKSIKKGGHIGIGNITSSIIAKEKEIFDDLKPRGEISNISIEITRGQQTHPNVYQNPCSQPKNVLERINSHDSGMPESPGSQYGDGMEFYNLGFVEDSTDGRHGPIQSISRNVSVGESDGVSSLWRQSGISNGSEDSGADVMVKEGAVIVGPRPTSSSTDEVSRQDPYFKLSAPPLSSQSSDFSSPYIKTPVGQDERMHTDEENEDADEFENDCPFDDGDSNSGYLQQYQLGSPTSLTAEVPPYMKMTPISPPPVSSCVPNGYVSTESLPCPHKGNTGGLHDQKGSVPEEYSTMVDSQGGSEGYLKHNVIPTSKQISEIPEIYIKHTSLPSNDVNYQDDYPDFNHNVPQGPTLGPKQESGGYVQHKNISLSILQEPPYISNTSKSSTSSEMPYSKLALNDSSQY